MNKIFIGDDNRKYQKSRWIKVQYDTIKRSNHSLYNYMEGDNSITFFVKNGIKYAISQFMRLSYPTTIEVNEDDIAIIGGYDTETSYKPYLLEISDCGEYVRLWEEVSDI